MDGCYLLHFSEPYKHARHYLGWAEDLERRIEEYNQGRGARLTQVVTGAGITLQTARIWVGAGRGFERQLKNRKATPRLCPICQGRLQWPGLDEDVDFYGENNA